MESDLRTIAQGVSALHLIAEGLHALRELENSRAVRGVAASMEAALDRAMERCEGAWTGESGVS